MPQTPETNATAAAIAKARRELDGDRLMPSPVPAGRNRELTTNTSIATAHHGSTGSRPKHPQLEEPASALANATPPKQQNNASKALLVRRGHTPAKTSIPKKISAAGTATASVDDENAHAGTYGSVDNSWNFMTPAATSSKPASAGAQRKMRVGDTLDKLRRAKILTVSIDFPGGVGNWGKKRVNGVQLSFVEPIRVPPKHSDALFIYLRCGD